MPCDGTACGLRNCGRRRREQRAPVAGGDRKSGRAAWAPDNRLYFVSDRSDVEPLRAPIRRRNLSSALCLPIRRTGLGLRHALVCLSESDTILALVTAKMAEGTWAGSGWRRGHSIVWRYRTPSYRGSPLRGAARSCAPAIRTELRRSSCFDRAAAVVTELCTTGDLPVDPRYLARPKAIACCGEGSTIVHASVLRRPTRVTARRRQAAAADRQEP